MKLKAVYLQVCFVLIAVVFSAIKHDKWESEKGWIKDGEITPQQEHSKYKDGFGAQLLLIEDQTFFSTWNHPVDSIRIPTISTATKGKPLFAIILFANPAIGGNKKCNVIADMVIKDPNGKVYAKIDDCNIRQFKPGLPSNELGVGIDYMGVIIDPKDPAGTYTVEATVKDQNRNVTLDLVTKFTVK